MGYVLRMLELLI